MPVPLHQKRLAEAQAVGFGKPCRTEAIQMVVVIVNWHIVDVGNALSVAALHRLQIDVDQRRVTRTNIRNDILDKIDMGLGGLVGLPDNTLVLFFLA
ncbi:MAG: hypothetical protein JNN31_11910 [Dechloromonas sp.]|nr:hypothetical protein [Dechloromonas sp.]